MVKLKPFAYQPVLLVRVGHVRIAEHVSIHVHESVVWPAAFWSLVWILGQVFSSFHEIPQVRLVSDIIRLSVTPAATAIAHQTHRSSECRFFIILPFPFKDYLKCPWWVVQLQGSTIIGWSSLMEVWGPIRLSRWLVCREPSFVYPWVSLFFEIISQPISKLVI